MQFSPELGDLVESRLEDQEVEYGADARPASILGCLKTDFAEPNTANTSLRSVGSFATEGDQMSDSIVSSLKVWGYLRETNESAEKAGSDPDTGLPRTGLPEYLTAIFPETDDWIHDTSCNLERVDGKKARTRPDYRSELLKRIVEFDGLPHYTSPEQIQKDAINTRFYESHGYQVTRIPYFIQLTPLTVERLFETHIDFDLYDESVPSVGPKGRNTPAFLCAAGVSRMAFEFAQHPEQYLVNLSALKQVSEGDRLLAGTALLENEYKRLLDEDVDLELRFFDKELSRL